MKKLIGVILLLWSVAACADRAAELYQTAKFEELQNNKEHAASLYREVVEKYPDSAQAKEAAKRLSELKK